MVTQLKSIGFREKTCTYLDSACDEGDLSLQFAQVGVHVAAWTGALELHWLIMCRKLLVADGPANRTSHRYHLFDFFS